MKVIRTAVRTLFAAFFWTVVVSVLWVLLLAIVDPPVTWVMAEQAAEQATFQRKWRDLDEIAREMPLAVMAAEDQKFMDHFGFDMEAIRKAMDFNARKKGRKVKGASTISQQTAKNVFCWPGRTYVRKGLEAWFTLWIEVLWTKERIIEVYLNVAETGKGCFGVEAASQRCFGKPAARLSRSQAALIAAVLPSPRRFDCARPSGYVARRQAWIVGQMNNLGDLFDPAVRERMRLELERKAARRERRRK
ncbi:MAG: monofunctional biosynthetic peptidoglycan transglycosylase [Flavobacteriales bacterium]|nr:monofunctional biosynthetic peptidoglycan transglycosylase [Flavobacteriales bacterium]